MSQRCVLSPTSGPSAWRLTSEGGGGPRALALKASGLQWELPGPGDRLHSRGARSCYIRQDRCRAKHWDS